MACNIFLNSTLHGRIKSMRKMAGIIIIALFLATPVWAENTFKEGGKEVGQGFRKMGKETGQAVKEGGKEVGQGFKQMGKETGQAAKKTGMTVGEWFRDAGRKTGEAFREMGRNIKRFFTGG
jgi:hypothetical protein